MLISVRPDLQRYCKSAYLLKSNDISFEKPDNSNTLSSLIRLALECHLKLHEGHDRDDPDPRVQRRDQSREISQPR